MYSGHVYFIHTVYCYLHNINTIWCCYNKAHSNNTKLWNGKRGTVLLLLGEYILYRPSACLQAYSACFSFSTCCTTCPWPVFNWWPILKKTCSALALAFQTFIWNFINFSWTMQCRCWLPLFYNPLIYMGFIYILSLLCGVGKCTFVDKYINMPNTPRTSHNTHHTQHTHTHIYNCVQYIYSCTWQWFPTCCTASLNLLDTTSFYRRF